MKIVLLGSGNVATHLGKALSAAGHQILQVYSRTRAHAEVLAEGLGAAAIDHPSEASVDADAYFIVVKDDAIEEVVSQLPRRLKGVVAHTAGSVEMDILKPYLDRYGVFYPLQTFSKTKAISFSAVPIALEAVDATAYGVLEQLADGLSDRVFPCDSKQRLSLHIAAVFACNFTNYLYSVADNVLRSHNLDFSLIRPLVLETAQKVMEHSPRDVQTGPAVRRDRITMAKHAELLSDQEDLRELYLLLSKRIDEITHPGTGF